MINKKIGIIGCGNMGEALISRLAPIVQKKLVVNDIDKSKMARMRVRYKVSVEGDNKSLTSSSDVIILAVKPKDFDIVLKELKGSLSRKKLLISIAAGITTKYIERLTGGDIPVIRVMPNIPAIIGEAASSISLGSFAGKRELKTAKEIFASIGDVVEVDEDLVDAVTAISGSGPAYFFYLIESLIEAARSLGLDEKNARALVLKTALGSARLLEVLKEDPANLRAKVASKGGTTEAALKVFEAKELKEIIKEAVSAAYARSKELSKG